MGIDLFDIEYITLQSCSITKGELSRAQRPVSRKVSSLKSKILVLNLRFFLDFSQI